MTVQSGTRLRSRSLVSLPLRFVAVSPSLRFGLALLAALIALGIATRLFVVDPLTQNFNATFAPPLSPGHLLGTDQLGHDILAWVGAGILTSLKISGGVVALSAFVGTTVGLIAGYVRGPVDHVLMRLADLQLSVPPLPLFIAAAVVLSPGIISLIVLLSIVGWVGYARLVRARVLVERERGFIAAARLAGARPWEIIVVHLLRAVVSEVLVLGSLQAGVVLLWESGLSFLGLGLQPPDLSLGFLIAQGHEALAEAPWITTAPGVAIVLLVLAFNLIGDGLRDTLSPGGRGGGRPQ